MANTVNLWAESNADMISDDSSPALTLRNSESTGAEALLVANAATAGATIAPLRVVASTASQAFLSFSGGLLSSASIATAGSAAAFVIPVYHETNRTWGYITASKGVV